MMTKRVVSLFLALLLLVAPMLACVGTVQAAEETADIETLVREQFLDYVATFEVGDASEGAQQLLSHAVNGNGRKLNMDEDDAFTVTMLNAKLFQASVVHAATVALENMLKTYDTSFFMRGSMKWYTHGTGLQYNNQAYDDNENGNDEDDKTVFPAIKATCESYTGASNTYDEAMLLAAGSTHSKITLKRTAATLESCTYQVAIMVYDDFDFNTSYSGSNVSLANLLKWFGKFMSLGLWKTYSWTSTVAFEVTVPNSCIHQTADYRWEFNGTGLSPVTADGNRKNELTPILFELQDGSVDDPFFETDIMCKLHHDLPWVVEFRTQGDGNFTLSERANYNSGVPFFYKASTHVFVVDPYTYYITDGETGEKVSKTGRYEYSVKLKSSLVPDMHTYRLENRIGEDGSNMIYLLIDGDDYGPMDTYSTHDMNGRTFLGTSDWISGEDFAISYIFSNNYPWRDRISVEYVQIWENGENAEPHDYRTVTTVKPTHSAQGKTTTHCALCGGSSVEILPETHDEEIDPGYAATCTKSGLTDGSVCTACGKTLVEQEVIPALGHTEESLTATVTCTEPGLTEGKICSVCGEILLAQTESEALGHSWDEGKITTKMTCTVPGMITYTCGNDPLHTYTEEIPSAHSPQTIHGSEATCTNSGLTDAVKCSVCGEVLVRHTVVPPLGHSYETVVTEATCTEKGFATHTCAACGDSYVDSLVDAVGHSGIVDEAVESTCTESGLTEGSHCGVCGEVVAPQETIPATGHIFEDGKCIVCGEKDPELRLGDANGDSKIDNVDAMLILQYSVGLIDETNLHLSVCNVDGSEWIDNVDAMLVLQYSVGLIDTFLTF